MIKALFLIYSVREVDAKEVGRRVEPGSGLKLIRRSRRMVLTFHKEYGMRMGEVQISPSFKHISAWLKSTAGNISKHNHTVE